MTLNSKIELLKYQLLNNRTDYDLDVYYLFRYEKIVDIVNRINELSFSYQVNIKDNEITSTQFLKYMTEFIRYMKLYFYNMSCFSAILDEILRSCNKEINILFDYQCNDPYECFKIKKDNNIKERIFKVIISNFVKNAKYVPLIEDLLKENGIKLKNIQNYNLKESEKILNLLSDIVFCQRGNGTVINLFENIEYHLNEYIGHKEKRNSKKYTIEDYKKKYIDYYTKVYERMIRAYNTRKKYLKHFI